MWGGRIKPFISKTKHSHLTGRVGGEGLPNGQRHSHLTGRVGEEGRTHTRRGGTLI